MTDLGLSKEELIQYLQINLVKDIPDGGLVIALRDKQAPAEKPKA